MNIETAEPAAGAFDKPDLRLIRGAWSIHGLHPHHLLYRAIREASHRNPTGKGAGLYLAAGECLPSSAA